MMRVTQSMVSMGALSLAIGMVLTGCGGGGGVSNSDLPTSAAMIVDAGTNVAVEAGQSASFVGMATHQNRKITKTYWSQVSGAPLEMLGADCVVPGDAGGTTATPAAAVFNDTASCALTVKTVRALTESSYRFRFTAIDADGNARYDDVDLRVTPYQPVAPVVDAGMDMEVPPNVEVTTTCSYTGGYWESTTPNPKYSWRVVSTTGSVIPALNATNETLKFTAPTEANASTIVLECAVQDEAGLVGRDTATIRVQGLNDLPPLQANAGAAQSVKVGTAVTLDASGTTDPSNTGTPIYYLWEQVSGPSVTLANKTSAQASFVAPDVASSQDLVFRVYVDRKAITDATKNDLPSSQKAETVVRVKKAETVVRVNPPPPAAGN